MQPDTPRSRVRRLARLPALLLLGLAVGACASIPEVDVPAGSRVEVRLYDAGQAIELHLANASHPDLQDVYSERRRSAALKLAPDQLMGQLLASLERAELDVYGTQVAGQPAGADAGAAYSAGFREALFGVPPRTGLAVRRGAAWTRFREPAADASEQERAAFARCKLVINEYYSHVGGLQYIANPEGRGRLSNQKVETLP